MSAALASYISAACLLRPIAAAIASLAAVSSLTILLGIAFLPAEIQAVPQFASVTHSVELGDGAAVSLFWAMPCGYAGGRKHFLAVHAPDGSRSDDAFPWPHLRPVSLANGPELDQVLVGTWDGFIHLLDAARATSELVGVAHHPGGVIALACSADGQCLVSQGNADLRAWDLWTKSDRWRRTDVAHFCFALSPDSQTAFVASLTGEALQIDLHSGRTLRCFARFESPILQVALSPNGSALAILGGSGRLLMVDIRTGMPLWDQPVQYPVHQAPARVAVFSPCGQMLVTADHERGNSLVIWDVATGRRLRELRGHRRIVHGAAFASTGELRSWSADGTIRVWNPQNGATLSVAALEPPLNAT